jgi:hypothetical protein
MKRDLTNRNARVIARGEVSGHSHIITGECNIEDRKDGVYVKAGKNCAIKHLLELPFVNEGLEVSTKEHGDIPLQEGTTYKYIQQIEYNPYEKAIQKVKD